MPSDRNAYPPAILLMGPTAAGKTDLAVRLVQEYPCEIISVDSAMIYRGMDIGTAKPGPEILAIAPHRLIDRCDPTASYSAARFRADALEAMAHISGRGRIPLLVGGTMLYFRALLRGLSPLPEADAQVRAQLDEEAAQRGWPALHRRLARIDPRAARRIHPNDPQRIQRALEVFALTGRPLSELLARKSETPPFPYRPLKLVWAPRDRSRLHPRIARRFQRMLAAGFEEEVRTLWARGDLTREMPSMRTLGYRQMLKYILGESSYDHMCERTLIATRQFAKRQYTWLRAERDCHWLSEESAPERQIRRLVDEHRMRAET